MSSWIYVCPGCDGRSCPADYAAHNAYRDAAKIARAALSDLGGDQ